MKWLQWATYNLQSGLGGVEVHARSIHRELQKLGVDSHISADPRDFVSEDWDVVHTHGSGISLALELRDILSRKKNKPIRLHGFHGESLGRMKAMGEWDSPRGYLGALHEWVALMKADIVASDHDNIFLWDAAQWLGKKTVVASNGWDAFFSGENLPSFDPGEYWLFVGRGADPVKGAPRLKQIAAMAPDLKFVANPGAGFEDAPRIFRTGVTSPDKLADIFSQARGLIIPSHYEGLPLVALEALAMGLPVVAAAVGGLKTLSPDLKGLTLVDTNSSTDVWVRVLRALNSGPPIDRAVNAKSNQLLLPSWKQVAECLAKAVLEFKQKDPPSVESKLPYR